MRTLVRSVGRADIGGEPLPSVFKTFDANKIIFRRAEVSMLAGTPGVGKSTLALALALRMKVPSRSEEHTSELQSRFGISYAVFCLKKKE